MIDPATGALQIRPEYRDKAAKALMRDVRRMKLRLKLQLLRLYFRKFALDLRSAILVGESYFVSNRNKLSCKSSHWRFFPSVIWKKIYAKPGLLSSPGYSPL